MRTPIRALSGGERNRLLLATPARDGPCNLLVLDEPTNDLDMDTLDLLQEMLAEFAGTLLLVSHDRDFLDRLVTSVIAFEGAGRLQEYAGGYRDYLRQRRAAAGAGRPGLARAGKPGAAAGPLRLASRRQRELDRVIAEIEALESEIAALERDALRPGPVRPRSRRASSGAARGWPSGARRSLEAAERRWSALEDAARPEPAPDGRRRAGCQLRTASAGARGSPWSTSGSTPTTAPSASSRRSCLLPRRRRCSRWSTSWRRSSAAFSAGQQGHDLVHPAPAVREAPLSQLPAR